VNLIHFQNIHREILLDQEPDLPHVKHGAPNDATFSAIDIDNHFQKNQCEIN